jgi:5-methylcytosine-specific restriction endonuclease McrA
MQDRKQQRLNDFYTKIWRRDAICKLVKVGVRFKKEPKNKEIEKYLLDNYIPFQDVRAFCLASIEASIVTENKDTEQKTSRKIKSTLPCPTLNKKTINRTNKIKPTGYKQKSKKSEIVNCDNIYDTWTWKDLRYQALSLHGRRCMSCGKSPRKDNSVVLHVDHIKPVIKHPELALDINNLQVLCGDCNQGKGYWDETDFRKSWHETDSQVNVNIVVSEDRLSALHDFAAKEYNENIPPWIN